MAKKEVRRKTPLVISLGGSIIIPKEGFDVEFLKRLKNLIVRRVKKGDRFILVIGGGAVCRQYQKIASQLASPTDTKLDELGIEVTRLNARLVQLFFGDLAHKEIISDPTRKIITKKPIILAGGWKPGCSTDRDAVLLAKTYGAKEIINASNIDYVYSADPKIDASAQPMPKLNWQELRKIVGNKWSPGANLPFDPLATKEAQKLGLKVKFVKGVDLEQLEKAIEGKEIKGSIVS